MNRKNRITSPVHGRRSRQRGVAAILAMMFLVIFGSLAAAMAIVAQSNLSTADSQMKITRTLACSETGLRFVLYRMNLAAQSVQTRAGEITAGNAPAFWDAIRQNMLASLSGEPHNQSEPVEMDRSLRIGPISLAADMPAFTATITPHPIAGENYGSSDYQRYPYNAMSPVVSADHPLDATWLRIHVHAVEGPAGRQVGRAIQMDIKLEKKVRFAILSRNRVMIGANVMVQGPVGSRFMEVNLPSGHPVQMVSDFRGLNSTLNAQLEQLTLKLAANDQDGDNRLNLADLREVQGINNPSSLDRNGDGYIDDYDYFLGYYDTQGKGYVTAGDLNATNNIITAQLLEMIDGFGEPTREGYRDGRIDASDRYAKIRGQVMIAAGADDWRVGAAQGDYQAYFQGLIQADAGQAPLAFQSDELAVPAFSPNDFDVSTYRAQATGNLTQQAQAQAAVYDPSDPNSPKPLGTTVHESVPYGAAHPYDYYDRPVYENMVFTNVTIPAGSNALFKNCTFIGVTFVQTAADTSDPMFNYAGMQQADGTMTYPSVQAVVNGQTVSNTKTLANNLRFDGCTIEGSVVTDVPQEFAQARNKLAFTGTTRFVVESSTNLSQEQKELCRRSAILAPQMSVEMGSYSQPSSADQTVQLTGTIVAGVIDLRGQVHIDGTLLTTYEPVSDQGPVIGPTSPNYNTTLGYFSSLDGDMEAEVPSGGRGVIRIRYNKTRPLPDGILAPVSLTPNYASYTELSALP